VPALRRVRALAVRDAPPGGHPVHVARADRLPAAERVAMEDLAVEQVGDGGEPDMRVRPHVEPLSGKELARPHLVEEDEGADHLPLLRGQGAAHLEAAHVVGTGQQNGFDGRVSVPWPGDRGARGRMRDPAPPGGADRHHHAA
jgi:hypothetical protein